MEVSSSLHCSAAVFPGEIPTVSTQYQVEWVTECAWIFSGKEILAPAEN